MKSSTILGSLRPLALLPLLALSVAPAFAHHMEDGKLPGSFTAGLLSGLGHPVIGLDHLAFMAGVGIACAYLPRGIIAVLAFVAATIAGCVLHLQGATLPGAEILVAATVLIVGAVLMTGRQLPPLAAALAFALAGLFHGYAYGESIFGAEQTPLAAYLIGFAVIQFAVASAAMLVTRAMVSERRASAVPARLAGAVIAGIGLTFLVQNVETIVIPAPAPIVELANGCICCTVADDFIPTMEKLLARDPAPDHIVIETSGLALPQPLVRAFGWPEVRARVTVNGVVTVVDARAVADGRFAEDETAIAVQRQADPNLDHDSPLHELFEDQLGCADLIILNKADLVSEAELAGVAEMLTAEKRAAAWIVRSVRGQLSPDVLIGLAAAAEDDTANRLSHHERQGEAEHDHDDFESFVVAMPPIEDPRQLSRTLIAAAGEMPILRAKGFLAVEGKPMRLAVQGVGPRVDSYFDRPWRDGEQGSGHLVIIGLKGLDREAIAARLGGTVS